MDPALQVQRDAPESSLSPEAPLTEPSLDPPTELQPGIRITVWRHLLRTGFILVILFLEIFFNNSIQVWGDNEALSYYYGVTTDDQWGAFNESMHEIANNETYRACFPNIIIQKKFGGWGDHGKIDLPPDWQGRYLITRDRNGDKNDNITEAQALLLDDVIFRDPKLQYLKIRAAADLLAGLLVFLTVVFLLLLPYFYEFKTKVKRTICPSCVPIASGNSTLRVSRSTSILRFPHRFVHGLVFVRRLAFIIGFSFVLRGTVVGLDILPHESYECIPMLRLTFWSKIYGAFRMCLGLDAACHDFIFSGHTTITTIMAWFWITYNTNALFHPKRYRLLPKDSVRSMSDSWNFLSSTSSQYIYTKAKRSFVSLVLIWMMRILAIAYIFVMGFCLIASRIHYTVDVGLAIIIGTLVFWGWHLLLETFYLLHLKGHILSVKSKAFNTAAAPGGSCSSSLEISKEDKARHLVFAPGIRVQDMQSNIMNIELRDVLVPITRLSWMLKFVGWCDGYDIYQHDGIGFADEWEPNSDLNEPSSLTQDEDDGDGDGEEIGKALIHRHVSPEPSETRPSFNIV